jgi:hypothetical protein
MAAAQRTARVLLALMLVQSALGVLSPAQYRDVEWIRATWYGNDWITLAVAVPLLWLGTRQAARDSVRGPLLVLGTAGFAAYNYAFYLFGAALNVFFPLYVATFLVSIATLGLFLWRLDVPALASRRRRDTPVRPIGGYLILVAVGLTAMSLGIWGAYAFAGRPTPIEPEAFKVVAALDLSFMVPLLTIGGVLLWRGTAWGYVIGTIAATQAALYLLVLSVNSVVLISRGLTKAPGELPIWGLLTIFTAIATLLLLRRGSKTRADEA